MEISEEKNKQISLKELLLFYLSKWYYFVIVFFICGIIGIIYMLNTDTIWNTSSTVSLRHDEGVGGSALGKASSLASSFGLSIGSGTENIEDETLKMKSQGYISKVVKNLGLNTEYTQFKSLLFSRKLFDQSPILLQVDPSLADTLSRVISFDLNVKSDKTTIKMKVQKGGFKNEYVINSYPATLNTPWGNFTFNKAPAYASYKLPIKMGIRHASYDHMAQEYREELSLGYEKRTSDLIHLGFDSENTSFAKALLSEIVDVYNEEWDADKRLVSGATIDYIDNQLSSTKEHLADADFNIKQFKDKYNLTDVQADVTYYLKATGELQAQLLEAETQINLADIIFNFVNNEKNKYALIPFDLTLSDANMISMIENYNKQMMQRNELYKANTVSPMVTSLDEQMKTQRENILISLKNIKESLLITRNNIKNKETEYSQKIGNVPSIEQGYVKLIREREIQQTLYALLLQIREQTAITGINVLPKLKTITPPYVNKQKVFPRFRHIALFVFIAGTLISLGLIYGVPLVRNRKRKD